MVDAEKIVLAADRQWADSVLHTVVVDVVPSVKDVMTDLRMIISEFAKGTPMREIERKLNLSRTSLRTYKERAEQSGKSMYELQSMVDAELHGLLTRADAHRGP